MVISGLFRRRNSTNTSSSPTSETSGFRKLFFRKRRTRSITVLPLKSEAAGQQSSSVSFSTGTVFEGNDNPAGDNNSSRHSRTSHTTNTTDVKDINASSSSWSSSSPAQTFWGQLQKNHTQLRQPQRWRRGNKRRQQRRLSLAETVGDGSSASSSAWYPTSAGIPPMPPVLSTTIVTTVSHEDESPATRSVSFRDTLDVKEIAPRSSLTEALKEELWLQPEEYHQIRARIRRVLEYAEEHPEPHTPGARKLCLRGLESMRTTENTETSSSSTWFDAGAARIQHHNHHHLLPSPTRMNAWDCVLDEQKRQRKQGIKDDNALAVVYRSASLGSAREAQDRALNDAKAVKAYLRRRRSVAHTPQQRGEDDTTTTPRRHRLRVSSHF